MYLHIDNSGYSERKAGVATSSSICGAYTYRGSSKPLGHDSLDDNRLTPDRLVDQRQPVHDRVLDHRHVERLAQLRPGGYQHLQLAGDRHPADQRQQHDQLPLPRRPVELRQPRRLPVHLGAAHHQRHHRVDDLPHELDRRHGDRRRRLTDDATMFVRVQL
jgi:hypothetical protein